MENRIMPEWKNKAFEHFQSSAKKATSTNWSVIMKGSEMEKKTENIYAVPEEGYWVLVNEAGEYVQEGFPYRTKEEAEAACPLLWQENSMWHGRRPAWCIDLD